MNPTYLFVYGSLKSTSGTEWSRKLAANASLVGNGRVNGTLFPAVEYPGMVPAQRDDDWVVGELHQLADPVAFWPLLDEYEGDDFERRETSVRMDDGREINAWAYYYVGDISGKSPVRNRA